jgi:LysM repeat protein
MKQPFYILIFLAFPFGAFAQSQTKVTTDYINKYKGIAISEMNRTGIPASITLAQAIVESASGESNLAKQANNHFGIKCKTEWTGEKMYKDDDMKNECFRVYENADSSFIDHSNFLKYRPYYASLFELDPVDDTAWAYGLKKAGYATEKDYPNILLKVIDMYELSQYNFPELVEEDSLEEANAIKAEITKDTLQKKVTPMQVAPNTLDTISIKKPVNSTPIRDTVVKIVTVKDTIIKVVTVKDTIVNTVTVRDTLIKIVTVKDTVEKAVTIKPTKDTTAQKTTPKAIVLNYPLNQKFKINGVSAIWAIAGRSYIEIASAYNIPLYKLYKNNELEETDLVQKDQLLFLAEKKKDSDKKVHVAKTGETFYEIAQMEGIQLNALKSFNTTITEDKIKDGIILYLFNVPKDPTVPLPADKTKANNSSDKKASDITPKKNKFKIF